MNKIARLEFELAYYDFMVRYVSHCFTGTPHLSQWREIVEVFVIIMTISGSCCDNRVPILHAVDGNGVPLGAVRADVCMAVVVVVVVVVGLVCVFGEVG